MEEVTTDVVKMPRELKYDLGTENVKELLSRDKAFIDKNRELLLMGVQGK